MTNPFNKMKTASLFNVKSSMLCPECNECIQIQGARKHYTLVHPDKTLPKLQSKQKFSKFPAFAKKSKLKAPKKT